MSVFFQAFCCIVFAICLFIFLENFSEISKGITFFQIPVVLVVGILSSRENFLNRNVLRSTWMSKYQSENSNLVKSWFILGSSSCSIPPDYRLSFYGCEKWKINVTDLEEKFHTLKETEHGNCSQFNAATIHQGFTFKVHHPVVVTKLGVLLPAVRPNTKSKVAILDIHSKEILVEVVISRNESESVHGYQYVPVENILFPKNYEGLVLFEGYLQHSICTSLVWDNGGGVITFKKVYLSSNHQDSKKYSHNSFSAVSIGFFINDMDKLKKIKNEEAVITEKWQQYLKEVETKIELEKNQHEDIIIVDSVDIYRNLPIKVLKFYEWLHLNQKFLYVMKTDDDTVVNLEVLLNELQHSSRFNSNKYWLWSRFRKNWPVNYVGKWADDDYRSDYYPTFPCGAAYITSQHTAAWISNNVDSLFPYQGEDVSLGIWLSAINPDFIEDDYFECGSSCNNRSYNRAQLETDEIQRAWSTFKKCKSICNCNNL